MSRQEAATRLRDDPGAAASVLIWGVTIVAVLFATAWHLVFAESSTVSVFGLCAGATLAVALNLFADVMFHHSGMGRGSDGHGSLAAFITTVFPPFVPATVLLPDGSYVVVGYLTLLFAAAGLIAWTVGEQRGYLRLQQLFKRTKLDAVQSGEDELVAAPVPEKPVVAARLVALTTPAESVAAPKVSELIPVPASPAQLPPPKAPIVLLPQPRPLRDAPQVADRDRMVRLPILMNSCAACPGAPQPAAVAPPQAPPVKPVRMFKSHAEMKAERPVEPRVSQWLKRSTDETGSERVEGTIRVTFAAGQRQTMVHIPFIPALATVPRIDCHPLDGSHVRLKVGLAQKFGMRIEARRADASVEPLTVDIAFTAIPNDGQSDAA